MSPSLSHGVLVVFTLPSSVLIGAVSGKGRYGHARSRALSRSPDLEAYARYPLGRPARALDVGARVERCTPTATGATPHGVVATSPSERKRPMRATRESGGGTRVEARVAWTRILAWVEVGDAVLIREVSGRWTTDARCVDVDWRGDVEHLCPSVDGERRVTTAAPLGALLWRTSGMRRAVFRAEAGGPAVRVERAGYLELRINDTALADNRGALTVDVVVLSP